MSVEISFLAFCHHAVCASQLVYVGCCYLWWYQVFHWGEEGRQGRGTFEHLIVYSKARTSL